MHTHNPLTIKELNAKCMSKMDAFKDLDCTFDFALPQGWLNEFADWCEKHAPEVSYHLILSSTVWAYPSGGFGGPITCCSEVKSAFDHWERCTRPLC